MLTDEDYEQVMRLLGAVSEPSPTDVIARRTTLAKGLAELVGADIYLWIVGISDMQNLKRAMPTTFIDGGWKSEAQCTAFYAMAVNSEVGHAIQTPVHVQAIQNGAVTGRIVDLVPSDVWEQVKEEYYGNGYVDAILSMRRIGKNGFSCIGLHRERGRSTFSPRERFLVHTIFHNIDWIHSPGCNYDVGSVGLTLTFRQREVLLLLLRGKSRKSIAASLGLSEHTVVSYLRQIYRRFNACNQHELLSQFVSGKMIGRDS